MLEVNVLGLCIATREAIQDMERRGVAGHVVHVSSMAGHASRGPTAASYAATKFAVRALTERCASSCARARARSGYGHLPRLRLHRVRRGLLRTTRRRRAIAQRLKTLAPEDVAEAIVWVVTRPPHMEVHDLLVRPTAQKN